MPKDQLPCYHRPAVPPFPCVSSPIVVEPVALIRAYRPLLSNFPPSTSQRVRVYLSDSTSELLLASEVCAVLASQRLRFTPLPALIAPFARFKISRPLALEPVLGLASTALVTPSNLT